MRPVEAITPEHMAYWSEFPDRRAAVIGGPPDEPDCIPCPAIITISVNDTGKREAVYRVPLELDDDDRAAVAAGGTIWLSTWGGLPIHMVEISRPDG